MESSLTGRVVAITGASSGIGAATAIACGERGMRVGLFARRELRLEQVARSVESGGGEAAVHPGDVSDRAAVEAFVTEVARRWGRLDIVIANAGFGVMAPVSETPPAIAREIFDVNVLGSLWAIQAAWPLFAVQRRGHIVLVSSIVAHHALPGNAVYSATKAAQANLAEGLRVEGEPVGVDVSVVYPIGTDTEFVEAARKPADRTRQGLSRNAPRQSADEVARAIVRCLERPKFEVYPYGRSRLLPWLEAISPAFTDRVLGFRRHYHRQTNRELDDEREGGN